MHADLSRITFRPERGYSAVVAQQGRVQLDSDANEQALIQLHEQRVLLTDLIGPHGGPVDATGFGIQRVAGPHGLDDLAIGSGRYYVGGIRCDAYRPAPGQAVPDEDEPVPPVEQPSSWTYWDQPDGFRDPELPGDRLPEEPYLIYLKVWERIVTAAEDPQLREVALGAAAPDTSARVKVVWQVLALPAAELGVTNADAPAEAVREAFDGWTREQRAQPPLLAARSRRPADADTDPCLVSPEARYRGPENQLYRVEIHEGGAESGATFKWSRENGSVTFPADEVDGTWVALASLGGDEKLDLDVGDFVEVVDTAYTSRLEPKPLLRVEELDLPERRVRLSEEPGVGRNPELHPFLRRWDQREGSKQPGAPTRPMRGGAIPVEEGRWLRLEDGVEVCFKSTDPNRPAYRTGDHWLIPARTATGDVEWPTDPASRPLLREPTGILVQHAPLAWVAGEQQIVDLRLTFGLT
ncbi:DUF6519 domain-containing protein [Saccharopolyspora sp. NFXS83]|uniref:DUF6519 domain-containing protein n=1 Tax=Saccharopolyspora sp. NFXS83 TaxID=2993560 RepID=UPI00224A4E47|nr:DUF6519 domain-containing protein [Saccharopolyspora sp. NFXS83]MCX2731939.1 DUF6519 domain-containing protein [Saccharopolyspora sp. NFXS83]